MRITGRLLAVALPTVPAAVLLLLDPPRRIGPALASGLHAHDGGSGLLVAAVGVAAWAVVAWLLLGLVVGVLATAPGAVGATARRVSGSVTPAVLRSLLSGGTAVGLALTPALLPVAAHAAACAPTAATGVPSLDRPVSRCAGAAVSPPTQRPTPGPAATSPAAMAPTAARPAPQRPAGTRVVRAGDTLWAVAGAELHADGLSVTAARVAARWPAWWQANRAVIGPDPGLLLPGEVLRPPTATPANRESS